MEMKSISWTFSGTMAEVEALDSEARRRGLTRSGLIRATLVEAGIFPARRAEEVEITRPGEATRKFVPVGKPKASSSRMSPADEEKIEGSAAWRRRMISTGQSAKIKAWDAKQEEEF